MKTIITISHDDGTRERMELDDGETIHELFGNPQLIKMHARRILGLGVNEPVYAEMRSVKHAQSKMKITINTSTYNIYRRYKW